MLWNHWAVPYFVIRHNPNFSWGICEWRLVWRGRMSHGNSDATMKRKWYFLLRVWVDVQVGCKSIISIWQDVCLISIEFPGRGPLDQKGLHNPLNNLPPFFAASITKAVFRLIILQVLKFIQSTGSRFNYKWVPWTHPQYACLLVISPTQWDYYLWGKQNYLFTKLIKVSIGGGVDKNTAHSWYLSLTSLWTRMI